MRAWRSKLYIPQRALDEVDATLRDARGVDTGSTLWPACDVCSRRTGVRFAVESYCVADRGKTTGGDPFTDVKATCHGEEQVIRIEGLEWDFERDSLRGDITRVAALGALSFFIPGEMELRIPAAFFRAFIDEKRCAKRAIIQMPRKLRLV